jgi:hypothetical protein
MNDTAAAVDPRRRQRPEKERLDGSCAVLRMSPNRAGDAIDIFRCVVEVRTLARW